MRSANPTDCATQEDSSAGLGRCVVATVRKYTPNRYEDNRVEVLFARTADVVRSHGFGLAFGDGRGDQTNACTDGDVLYGRVRAPSTAGGQPSCP